MTTEAGKAPATKAGQALLDVLAKDTEYAQICGPECERHDFANHIGLIEAEAAAAARGEVTVERLAKALESVAVWRSDIQRWVLPGDDIVERLFAALAAHDPATPA